MPIVQLPGGEVRDEIRQPLYDTVELLPGQGLAGVYNFFSSIVTPAGLPKTIAKTNMTTPGQLQTAVSFRCQGLCLDAMNSESAKAADWLNAQVIPTIINRGGVQLNVGVKTYWQGPARFAAGRMQEMGFAGTAFPNTTPLAGSAVSISALLLQQYGWAAIQPVVFQGRHVIDINPLQNFLFQLSVNTQDLSSTEAAITIGGTVISTDISLVASLKGLQRRPVQ